MKKYFTKILAIAAMLLSGAWNVNGQNYQTSQKSCPLTV